MRLREISAPIMEGRMGVEDLPDDLFVCVKWVGARVVVYFCDQSGTESQNPKGYVGMVPLDDGPYQIITSYASHGWGPMLYDIAMEYAGRFGVTQGDKQSEAAKRLWDFYRQNRQDVEKRVGNDGLTILYKMSTPTIDTLKRLGRILRS